jgi:spore germination cell wall hydrolase CwlJ-like protein
VEPCPIHGCDVAVEPDKLMCPAHWRMVPQRTKNAVSKAWANVRGASRSDLARALREHRVVKAEAIAAVEAKLR